MRIYVILYKLLIKKKMNINNIIDFSKPQRLSKIYSSNWNMRDEKTGKERAGTSYKAQLIAEDLPLQPTLDLTKEAWEKLGFDDEVKISSFCKIPVLLIPGILSSRYGNRIYILDIQKISK